MVVVFGCYFYYVFFSMEVVGVGGYNVLFGGCLMNVGKYVSIGYFGVQDFGIFSFLDVGFVYRLFCFIV